MKNVTISADLLEREEISTARSILTKILAALSDEALAYVWRPIMYAYLWTDEHDPDRLTDDDLCRLRLSVAIANSPPGEVERLCSALCVLLQERRCGYDQHGENAPLY